MALPVAFGDNSACTGQVSSRRPNPGERSTISRFSPKRQSKLTWAEIFGRGGLLIANGTVVAMPWLLGGTIPLARLVLQCGAVAALVLSVLSGVISRGTGRGELPQLLLPLLGFGGLAIAQLLPIHGDPVARMEHAVHADARGAAELPATASVPRSLAPGSTRLFAAWSAALAALLLVVCDQVRSRRMLFVTLTAQVTNAAVLAAVALTQQFGGGDMLVGEAWIRSEQAPFGTFVNPNHAAGWFLAQLALATMLWRLVAGRSVRHSEAGFLRSSPRAGSLRQAWENFGIQLASLNGGRVGLLIALALISASVPASLSRGGVLALVLAVTLTVVILSGRRPVRIVAILAGLGVGSVGLVVLLRIDRPLTDELATLSEPVRAGAARLRLWRDASWMLPDFPLLGCGFGTWELATLPYLTTDAHAWFRHADNQVLEWIVEGGLAGAVFLLIGCGMVIRVLRRLHRSAATDSHSAGLHRCLLTGLLLLVIGQLVCAAFDYGISQCATSSLVTLSLAACLGVIAGGRSRDETPPAAIWRVSRLTAFSVRVITGCAAASFVPDLWMSHQVYQHVITGTRVSRDPDWLVLQKPLPEVRGRLAEAMTGRPDDVEGLLMQARLAETAFRAAVLEQIPGIAERTPEEFRAAWEQTALSPLTWRLLELRNASAAGYRQAVQGVVDALAESDLLAEQRRVLDRLRIVPLIPMQRATLSAALGQRESFRQLAERAVFLDPSASSSLYNLGRFFRQLGDWDQAIRFWQLAIAADESHRAAALLDGAEQVGVDQALTLFAPASYRETVNCLKRTRPGDLRDRLIDIADAQWGESERRPGDLRSWRLRDTHLQLAGRPEEALQWTTAQIRAGRRDVEILVRRAQLYEQLGRPGEALQEWRIIRSIRPDSDAAAAAIERLSRQP